MVDLDLPIAAGSLSDGLADVVTASRDGESVELTGKATRKLAFTTNSSTITLENLMKYIFPEKPKHFIVIE